MRTADELLVESLTSDPELRRIHLGSAITEIENGDIDVALIMLRQIARSLLAGLVLLFITLPAHAFPAIVGSCHDGDTCTMLVGQSWRQKIHVRFADIDSPEVAPDGGQPYGAIAHSDLVKLIMGQTVDVESRGTDRYGRTIGTVWFGKLDVNEALVEEGNAWAYPAYDRDPKMPALENMARAAHRGLWSNPSAEAPWVWRKEHRH